MKTRTTLFACIGAVLALASPIAAQDQDMFQLPEQCSEMPLSGMEMAEMNDSMTDHGMDHDMEMGADDGDHAMLPEHVRENMQKMLVTMPAMRNGMMQQDADIAFACGMIAHHQAAIDMAEVVLDHGEDEEMRTLAEEIVEAQTREIEFMTKWLETTSN